jgi:hypothetical protein
MRAREKLPTGEQDLFRSRLDQIIDLEHALAKLGRVIDWRFLESVFGAVYTDAPAHPPFTDAVDGGPRVRGMGIRDHQTAYRSPLSLPKTISVHSDGEARPGQRWQR